MSQSLQLDLMSGGHAELLLEDPDEFPSSYFVSMEQSGNAPFWKVAVAILTAARRSIFKFGAALKELSLTRRDLTDASMKKLLRTDGYAFGVFRDVHPSFAELDAEGRQIFIFVRDPRGLVAEAYAAKRSVGESAPSGHSTQNSVKERDSDLSMADFVRSYDLEDIASQYRRLTDFASTAANVTIFRYEDCLFTWRGLVATLVRRLDLPVSRSAASAIADSLPSLASLSNMESADDAMYTSQLDPKFLADIEERFATSMAFLGYVPQLPASAVFTGNQSAFLRAISSRVSFVHAQCSELVLPIHSEPQKSDGNSSVRRPEPPQGQVERSAQVMSGLCEGDSVLGWRLKPNASTALTVLGRRVEMSVDSSGCRTVIGQPSSGEKTLAVYGCSLTFGWGINADETFCSLLQAALPAWRIENHGVGGYSSLQNLIQLQRDIRLSAPDYATFCWIPSHGIRNVGDPAWLQRLMKRKTPSNAIPTSANRATQFPCASLDPEGRLQVRPISFPRWDLVDIDLADLAYDPYYLNLVCAAIYKHAAEIVRQKGAHFFATTLMQPFSPQLRRILDDAGIPVVDACVKGNEFTLLPDDPHPNGAANKIYGEKILEYLLTL